MVIESGGEEILIGWLWSWTTVDHGKGRWGRDDETD